MKGKFVKITALACAVVVLMGILAGCGGSKPDSKPGSETQNAVSTAKPTTPVELCVEVFDRGVQGQAPVDNNYWTNWIQENFGKPNNITLKYVPVPRAQEVDKLNVLMASNEAPDIIFTYDYNVVSNYAKQGGLAELESVLNKNGQNLKKFLGEDVLKYGIFYGKQYSIPGKRILEGMYGTYIRKDWLDKLNMPVPTTSEEVYKVLKAFKEKDPGGLGGKVIPFGQFGSDFKAMEAFKPKMTEEEFYTGSNFYAVKDGVRYLNKLYNEGLLSPEFALDKDGKRLEADIVNGKVGLFINNVGYPYMPNPGLTSSLKKNVPGAELVPCDPFVNYDGKHVKLKNQPVGLYMMIPKTSKRIDEAVKYLDWMAKSDNLFFLQNGIEGVNYTLKDGLPVAISVEGEKKMSFSSNMDYTIIINGRDYGSLDKNIRSQALTMPGFENLFAESYKMSITDAYPLPRLDRPIEAEVKFAKTLNTKWEELFDKSVTAKPSDFDKVFDDMMEDYIKSGGQEVVNEKKAAYKEMKK